MKLNIKESFKSATAYMLRNDGKVFEFPSMHPYLILPDSNFSIDENIDLLLYAPRDLEWFYENMDSDFKTDVSKLLYSIYNNPQYFGDYRKNIDAINIPLIECTYDKEYTIELYKKISAESNQKFCRFRTSDLYGGGSNKSIYFRISSVRFNWFNLIWELVYKNKNFISNITIVRDSVEGDYFYKHKGKIFNEMPIDEFLTLSGNPIIESADKLIKGGSLNSAFGRCNLIRFNKIYNTLLRTEMHNYIKN